MKIQFEKIRGLLPRAINELRNPPVGASLPWMPRLTQHLGGLRPNEVTLLCAPTGTGKTELLATIAAQLTAAGICTFVAPVETGDVDFTARTFATICKRNLNQGVKVPEEILAEMELVHGPQVRDLPLLVANYDNRVAIKELADVLEYVHKTEGVQVALLDNLNFFLEVVSADKEKMEMDNAIHELVMFCKRIPIHVILIVHPRKTLNGRVESEFDIKGSSTAVQECANIALFNRPTPAQLEDGHTSNHRELLFKKIRKRGFYVNKPIWLAYESGHYSEVVSETKKPVANNPGNKPNVPHWND